MAEKGFNICIIARNEAKINEKLAEIKERFPKVKTKAIVADLAKLTTIADYRELVQQLNGLDVGYLALNAGVGSGGPFEKSADGAVEDTLILNTLHVVYLTKAMLSHFFSRRTRSAIVITSSLMAYLGIPGSCTYSATKALERLFGESLHYELRHKVDVMVFTPGFVNTKLLRQKAPLTVEPEDAVAAMHRDLGR